MSLCVYANIKCFIYGSFGAFDHTNFSIYVVHVHTCEWSWLLFNYLSVVIYGELLFNWNGLK